MALHDIELTLDEMNDGVPLPDSRRQVIARAEQLLRLAESVLEHWIRARGDEPTTAQREGFRLLALHRQGCKGEPSFNACRETCREVAYHYNLLADTGKTANSGQDAASKLVMMTMLVKHLTLFVAGKLADKELGDFCCSSRPLRAAEAK